ncbi:hypothetical protein D3C81_1881370 [compost metagenome]
MLKLQADVEVGAVVTHGLIKGQAGAGTLFAQDPGFMGQLFKAGLATLGQRVLRCTKNHQLVFNPGLDFKIRMVAVAFD